MDGTRGAGRGTQGRCDSGRRWGLKPNRQRHDDALSRVDHVQFEHLVADYFRGQGWQVDVVGAAASGSNFDGGIDLKMRRDEDYVVVQCKRSNVYQVTHNPVHELLGVMQTEGATGAIVAITGEFTDAACAAAAKSEHIQLLDGIALRRLLDPLAIERALRASKPTAVPFTGRAYDGDPMPDWRRASYRRPRPPRALRIVVGLLGFVVLSLMIGKMLPAFLHPRGQSTVPTPTPPISASPSQRIPPPSAYDLAGHLIGAQAALVVGADDVSRAHLDAFAHDVARNMRLPDATRPIDHESARAAVRPLAGVRSVIWLDRSNFAVMVDGQPYRTMAMIDEVCEVLAPLGDTLAVVVHVQDATAKNGDGATTLSRNCQLAVGERAMLQGKRQVDVIAPELWNALTSDGKHKQ